MLKVTNLLGFSSEISLESLQIVSFLFSWMTIIVFVQILKEFSVDGKILVVSTGIIALHPFFVNSSIVVNNDSMAMFFSALSIFFTLKWLKNRSLCNIVLIALSLGIAMFTKLNAGLVAVGIGIAFAITFFRNLSEWKRYAGQFVVFLIICAGIGLFSPIRSYIKFNVPLDYIQSLSANNPMEIKDNSLWNRIGLPSLTQISVPFDIREPEIECNIWAQLMRTAIVDGYRQSTLKGLFPAISSSCITVSIILACLLSITSLFGYAKRKDQTVEKAMMITVYFSLLIGYVYFCMSKPFTCTMSFRYIPTAILPPLIGNGLYFSEEEQSTISGFNNCKRFIADCFICFGLIFSILSLCVALFFIAVV